MPSHSPSPEAVEAAREACATTSEWATLAVEAIEPLIRKQALDEVRERLVNELRSERAHANQSGNYSLEFTAPEHVAAGIADWLAALETDQASERGTGKGGSPPKASELSADPETSLRRWTIWQPNETEDVPPSPGPMVMRIYAGPTLRPGEKLDLVSLSELEELLTGDEAVEAAAKARHGRVLYEHWADVGGERRMRLLDEARLDLRAVVASIKGEDQC